MMNAEESERKPARKTYPKRELTSEEKREAQRMRKLWEDFKLKKADKGERVTQLDLAKGVGLETQSAISQYLTGKIPLNPSVIINFSNYVGVGASEIRPSLGQKIKALGTTPYGESQLDTQIDWPSWMRPTDREIEDTMIQNGYPLKAAVPLLRREETSPGSGEYVIKAEEKIKIVLPREDIERYALSMEQINVSFMEDDSMSPAIPPGALVAIDRKDKTIVNRKIYALDYHGFLLIRLIYENPEGLMLKTFNPDYPGFETRVSRKDLQVLGRVFFVQYFQF